jgi:hypothetical protein
MLILGVQPRAGAQSIVVNSGSSVRFLDSVGNTATDFPAPFTPADFANAQAGPFATVLSLTPSYTPSLPHGPNAVWLGTNVTAGIAAGDTALYAASFTLPSGVSSASLTLYYAVDNGLGYKNPGIYINGTALPNSTVPSASCVASGCAFLQEQIYTAANIGPLLVSGTNWIYFDAVNLGGPGGLIFSAVITYGQSSNALYAPTVLADHPVAYYRLGEAPGAPSAIDASGHGHTGTYEGNAILGVPGLIAGDPDTAVNFNTTGDVVIPDATDLNFVSTPFTIEAWVSGISGGANSQRIFDKIVASTGLGYGFDVSNEQIRLLGVTNLDPLFTFGSTTTYHLVGVSDGAGTGYIYVNGTLISSGTYIASSPYTGSAHIAVANDGTAHLNNAVIDELAVYNYALSPQRILAHYAAGLSTNDLRLAATPYTDSVGPITVTWLPAFPDTNYTAICTAETTIGDFLLPTITARSTTGMQVSPSDGGPSVGTLDCIGVPDSDSSDLRHARASFSGLPTSVTVPWGTSFPDTNYTVSCTVETEGAFTGGFTSVINSITPTSVTAINAGFATGTMHCIGVPDSDTSILRHARVPVTGGQAPSNVPSELTVPWNPAVPNANYVAVCSDVVPGATASDSAIAILTSSKLTTSMIVIPEIPNGDLVHCIAAPVTSALLAVTTVSLPSGEAGIGYSAPLEATGGVPPYTWSVASGSVPAGVTLATAGVLSGMPTTAGTYIFTLQVTDSAFGTATQTFTVTIAATGTGTASATIQPTSLSFGNQVVTTSSTAQAVTITSNGTAPFLISSISVTGTNPTDFPEPNNCPLAPTGLGPGESCQIFVNFAPTAYGARSATLTITDNQGNIPGSQQSALLTGMAVDVPVVASTTYNITGNPFTVFSGSAACPPDCNISGSFTLSQPLPPNLSNATITPASFSFTVGTTNLTQANVTSASFNGISTDASGYITSWAILLSNANFSITTNNEPGNVADSFTIVAPQGTASNSNSPATWPKTVVTPVTFNPSPTPVSNSAVLNCPSGTVPCTDPNAHSLKLTVPAVSTAFTLTVTSIEVPASEANGICEAGHTEANDFDCRFVGYFTLQTNPNGDIVVPQCNPYSNGNCVFYRVSNTPPESYYTAGVLEYIAWNNTSYTPPPFYNANNPRLFDDPDDPPYDVNHQFVFDITTYYKPTGNYVGVDNGIGGRTPHFNDFVVAYPATPSYAYTLSFIPPLSSTRTAHFEQGDGFSVRFKLSPNTPAGIATQAPNHVGYSVLLDTNSTGCADFSGTIEPTVTPTNSPVDFTYDPEHQLYDLRLRGIYPAGQYKMLLSPDLAPEQCAVFVVTKDD